MTTATLQDGTRIVTIKVPKITATLRHFLQAEGLVILHTRKV